MMRRRMGALYPDPLAPEPTAAPRIPPGNASEIGRLNALFARAAGAVTGSEPPNIFTTLARHRRLFRRWLRFAGALMPGGVLPRAETELVILRVAHNSGCEYEWRHHERLGVAAGLEPDQVARVRQGPGAPEWSRREELLLRAADELHGERTLSDPLWADLRPLYTDRELIELCMLVGHYEMLAMTLNALAVEPDQLRPGRQPRLVRLLRRARSRRG
jgi:AhpD family alkylhydroperoxidase